MDLHVGLQYQWVGFRAPHHCRAWTVFWSCRHCGHRSGRFITVGLFVVLSATCQAQQHPLGSYTGWCLDRAEIGSLVWYD